jgi:hypothetical protein
MSNRELEAALLSRCAAVARASNLDATNQQEANVFRLAAMVIQSRFPLEARQLMEASDRYFEIHADERLAAAESIKRGWIINLPRLRDGLSHRLGWPWMP